MAGMHLTSMHGVHAGAGSFRSFARRPRNVHGVRHQYRSRSGRGSLRTAAQDPASTSETPDERSGSSSGGSMSSNSVPYEPSLAKGFHEEPWWVQKFEERRRRDATASCARNQTADSSGMDFNSSTADAVSAAADVDGGSNRVPAIPRRLLQAVLQLLQLCLALAALILWPASLVPTGLRAPRVWWLYGSYVTFFAGGTLYRLLRYGPLAPASQDRQRGAGSNGGATWRSRVSLVAFIASMPLLHWVSLRRFLLQQQQQQPPLTHGAITWYDALGGACIVAAVAINWWAASHLGRAYDRVVAPDVLVTSGPYALVQHPLYTSYMLLFGGYALALHSVPAALLALAVCRAYYGQRTRLEAVVLKERFGEQYESYCRRVRRLYVPGVW